MVMEDKGMRQEDWCLCVNAWGYMCPSVCVLMTREGLKSPGVSVIGREMGNWDYGRENKTSWRMVQQELYRRTNEKSKLMLGCRENSQLHHVDID